MIKSFIFPLHLNANEIKNVEKYTKAYEHFLSCTGANERAHSIGPPSTHQ